MTGPKIRNPIYDVTITSKSCLSTVNIIFEGFLFIFFAIMVQKWLLKNIAILIKAREQKPYPICDQNSQNQLKLIPYL